MSHLTALAALLALLGALGLNMAFLPTTVTCNFAPVVSTGALVVLVTVTSALAVTAATSTSAASTAAAPSSRILISSTVAT